VTRAVHRAIDLGVTLHDAARPSRLVLLIVER
jgi:hypothetical protein